jgi:hypothetical protein
MEVHVPCDKSLIVQEFKSSRVQEFKSSRVQEFKSSRVQEFKSLRVKRFSSPEAMLDYALAKRPKTRTVRV